MKGIGRKEEVEKNVYLEDKNRITQAMARNNYSPNRIRMDLNCKTR